MGNGALTVVSARQIALLVATRSMPQPLADRSKSLKQTSEIWVHASGGQLHQPRFGRPAECLARSGDAAEANVFDLHEFLDAIFRAFAAETGEFYAAEGGFRRRDQAGIDADHAVFQR